MSDKLIPANPADVMVIRDVTPNVVTFSVPFKRFGVIPVGGRGTVGEFTLPFLVLDVYGWAWGGRVVDGGRACR